MRQLSKSFVVDLKEDGLLNPLLQRVKQDDTLMLAIRRNYINVYYRGGSILRLGERAEGSYGTQFNKNYNKGDVELPDLPETIKCQDDAQTWADGFAPLKTIMDGYFSGHRGSEREYQQLVARENNNSPISNSSEYFISDIEFADSSLDARFDMLGIRWLATDRRSGANCLPALIEMKYGDGALDGSSGLSKHLDDIADLIKEKEKYRSLLETMESQFAQLDDLDLLNFSRRNKGCGVKLSPEDRPEVIVLLANHNPRSNKLASMLSKPDIAKYGDHSLFDLRFFVASYAGYGLYSDCMRTLDQFSTSLRRS